MYKINFKISILLILILLIICVNNINKTTIQYGISNSVGITFWPWLKLEEILKFNISSNNKSLRLIGHGTLTTFNNYSDKELAIQIISGKYYNDDGVIINNYYIEKINKNEDIIIELDSCNNGAMYYENDNIIQSYAYSLGKYIKFNTVNKYPNYSGKIKIKAANGFLTWAFGINYISKPSFTKLNGEKGKYNEFVF